LRRGHLDAIGALYKAISRRDFEALRSHPAVHPDFAWQSAPEEPDTGVRRGTESALAHSNDLFEAFDRIQIEIEREIDLGPEAAILLVSMRVRGAASGADAERREAHLWTARNGRLESLREFSTLDEAMAAARGSA